MTSKTQLKLQKPNLTTAVCIQSFQLHFLKMATQPHLTLSGHNFTLAYGYSQCWKLCQVKAPCLHFLPDWHIVTLSSELVTFSVTGLCEAQRKGFFAIMFSKYFCVLWCVFVLKFHTVSGTVLKALWVVDLFLWPLWNYSNLFIHSSPCSCFPLCPLCPLFPADIPCCLWRGLQSSPVFFFLLFCGGRKGRGGACSVHV